VNTLKDQNPSVRSEAVTALTNMGTWATDALPALYQTIRKDMDPGVRRNAVRSLEWIDPEGKQVVAILQEALKDKDPTVREKAADTIRSIRPFPFQALPALKAALAIEKNPDARKWMERSIESGERDQKLAAKNTSPASTTSKNTAKKPDLSGPSKEEAKRLLQEKGVQLTTDQLWSHAREWDIEIVNAMMAAGMSPEVLRQDMNLLIFTVRYYEDSPEAKQTILALIGNGADVNFRDQNNTTPLFYAAEICPPEILKAMIDAGGVLEVKANGGATTLSQAVFGNRAENVRMLLSLRI